MNAIDTSPGAIQAEAGYIEAAWPLKHITLAGVTWPASEPDPQAERPLLCVHGWLDNCLSFSKLAPSLSFHRTTHAVDLAGHGLSGHRALGHGYLLMDYVADLAELLDAHVFTGREQSVDLVGHSLGGIVCALYAAAFPERVEKLVMIDSLGALSKPVHQTVAQLRRSIEKRLAGSGKPVVYPDIDTAAQARAGGLSPLSHDAAHILTQRNMRPCEGGYVWRTDPRLRHPSPLMMTEEQVLASLRALQSPTLLIRADAGLLANRNGMEPRGAAIADLKNVTVPGGHHCHFDGNVQPVIETIRTFLNDE
ncbi:alpha/beta hydrolase [Marinobacter salinisoli]|uniref:Alpha/beta hydrolase n=1 Tax=Marinobacter salinisoli TaxID=2769486 RepID=A0ABX7MU18_9GAMM|nr:alpha/beta fold hydrolase [Marinobacter salinisoli]QSP93738.1 alpha/beta hydrolase [Marinobacter salinisoli]